MLLKTIWDDGKIYKKNHINRTENLNEKSWTNINDWQNIVRTTNSEFEC